MLYLPRYNIDFWEVIAKRIGLSPQTIQEVS